MLLFLLLSCQSARPTAPACPDGMVAAKDADGDFCIHRYEVSLRPTDPSWRGDHRLLLVQPAGAYQLVSEPGQEPLQVSWWEAYGICVQNHLHLCRSSEWEDACDATPGPGGKPYTRVAGDCNFTHSQTGPSAPLATTGGYTGCENSLGAVDMLGNLWEWTDPRQSDATGQPLTDKRGGAHYSRRLATCAQPAIGQHTPNARPSVGFRCCKRITPAAQAPSP